MEVGSLVRTVGNFERLRVEWEYRIDFPRRGDILTVATIGPHPNDHCRKHGLSVLTFEERPGLFPMSDKDIHGNLNFEEIQKPMDMDFIQAIQKEAVSKDNKGYSPTTTADDNPLQ